MSPARGVGVVNGVLKFAGYTGGKDGCQMAATMDSPGGGKKYELLVDQRITVAGTTLYRIRALRDFGHVKAGSLGGFVASECNLSHHGDCWIGDDARVYDEAVVSDNAQIRGLACIHGRARISDKGQVLGSAQVFDYGRVFKSGIVFDDAIICGHAQVRDDALVFGRARLCDYARVLGSAQVCGGTQLSGRTVVSGDEKVRRPSRGIPPRSVRRRRPRAPRGPHP